MLYQSDTHPIPLFLRKHWYAVVCMIILIVAAALYLYKLGQVPHGMTWDEAAIGYNGYALLTTRRDEWLVRFPVSFRSFGDYKAPLAIYINGVFTFLFGMNLMAVRLPFALAGIMTVGGMIWLVREVTRRTFSEQHSRLWAIGAGVLMTISPWHMHFSRAAFESGMALCFLVWGVLATWKILHASTMWHRVWWTALMSACLVASVYTYHSSKMVVPLLMVAFAAIFWRDVWKQKKYFLGGVIAAAIMLWPFMKDSLWGAGGERFTQATLFGLHVSTSELLQQSIKNFLVHLSPQFLVMGQTTTLRHGDGMWGMLLPSEVVFVMCGVIFLVISLLRRQRALRKLSLFAIAWIIIGILPAAIGRDVPHSNRALLALPGFILLTLIGLYESLRWLQRTQLNQRVSGSHGEDNLLVKTVLGMFIFFEGIFFLSYLHNYYTNFARASADDFKDGYIEAMQYAKKYESRADKILFTDTYGQPYIYALFVRKTNPIWYQGGSLIKYEFTNHINEGDRDRHKAVVVADPSQVKPKESDYKIYGSDGKLRFIIFNTIE